MNRGSAGLSPAVFGDPPNPTPAFATAAHGAILVPMPTPDDLSPLKAKPFSDAVDKLDELMTQNDAELYAKA